MNTAPSTSCRTPRDNSKITKVVPVGNGQRVVWNGGLRRIPTRPALRPLHGSTSTTGALPSAQENLGPVSGGVFGIQFHYPRQGSNWNSPVSSNGVTCPSQLSAAQPPRIEATTTDGSGSPGYSALPDRKIVAQGHSPGTTTETRLHGEKPHLRPGRHGLDTTRRKRCPRPV